MTDAELAAQLAGDAGRILLDMQANSGLSGKALGDAADTAANRYLCDAIRRERPNDGLLSEEERDSAARLDKSRVWIIDPVDGTREYGEAREDWAVHVGLAIDGEPAIGAVALPAHDTVLRTDRTVSLCAPASPPRMVVSRTRPARETLSVADKLAAETIPMGSAGAKAMAVIRGEAEIYLHSGGQHEWDNCAPAAVALAHGLHASRIDGSPLRYNNADAYVPDLLICRKEWASQVFAALREIPDGPDPLDR